MLSVILEGNNNTRCGAKSPFRESCNSVEPTASKYAGAFMRQASTEDTPAIKWLSDPEAATYMDNLSFPESPTYFECSEGRRADASVLSIRLLFDKSVAHPPMEVFLNTRAVKIWVYPLFV